MDRLRRKAFRIIIRIRSFLTRIFNPKEELNRLEMTLKCAVNAVMTYNDGEIRFRCAGLVYYTTLAVVPLLALIFSITNGLGCDYVIDELSGFIFSDTPETVERILGIAREAKVDATAGIVTVISSVVLFVAVWAWMDKVSRTVNGIWKLQPEETYDSDSEPIRRRKAWKMAVSRISLILLSPCILLLMYAQFVLLTYLEDYIGSIIGLPHIAKGINYLMLFAITIVGFTLIYKYVPYARVRFRHALQSGIVFGIIFVLFQIFYLHVQSQVSNYNVLYGALAAFPLFLLWAFWSWRIIMAGAVMCHSLECPDEYDSRVEQKLISLFHRS